jgi:hypothetical protein
MFEVLCNGADQGSQCPEMGRNITPQNCTRGKHDANRSPSGIASAVKTIIWKRQVEYPAGDRAA